MGEKKLRFGGMSTPKGMSLFGASYKAEVNAEEYTIQKGRILSPIMLFPFFDLAILGIYGLSNYLDKKYDITTAMYANADLIGIMALIAWIVLAFYIFAKIPKILEALRRFRLWHGTEHKVIAAAECNNLGEARKYSRINDRCGATFMLTILITYALWMNFIGPFGVFSITFLVMLAESKIFHKYNVPGIYLGRKIQEFTTAEPPEVMLNLGENAMGALILKEMPP